MVKNYLNKSLLVLGLLLIFLAKPVLADESYSSLFVKITDASTAVKQKDQEKAKSEKSRLTLKGWLITTLQRDKR